jgi:site-specific recombinase XerD
MRHHPPYKTALEEFRAEMVAELGEKVAAEILHPGKHLPAVPSRDEVGALYGMAKTTRDLLIVRTFYASGVRNGELVHLATADVLVHTSELFIRGGKEWAAYCTSSF